MKDITISSRYCAEKNDLVLRDREGKTHLFINVISTSFLDLVPAIFWALGNLGYVDVITDQEKRTNKMLLNVAYQEILELPKVNKYKYRALRA
ncbi:hypothetical protein [Portibacter marinus]|uniref:hypothetical protein n=1 Tax=Portibacter marinus TaxID=2898660 RepID=UPI001F3E262E|nr:hypothetical protein [Portibacter marinus]